MSNDFAPITAAVRSILWSEWDPIGVNDTPEAFGEYDAYAPPIVGMLMRGCTAHDLESHLFKIETDSMGLPGLASTHRAAAVAALIALRAGDVLSRLPLESLELEGMASGELSLRLTETISWEAFPGYAKRILKLLGGTIQDRADSPVERVWSVEIDGASFWLAFDDFALGVSLDPQDPRAGALIREIRERLLTHR